MILTADFVMRRAVHFGGTEAGFGVDLNRSSRPRVTAIDPITQVVSFHSKPDHAFLRGHAIGHT